MNTNFSAKYVLIMCFLNANYVLMLKTKSLHKDLQARRRCIHEANASCIIGVLRGKSP